ncbi:MAG: NAD+ synthase [Rhodospirillales bacterium]|nr:NAD+ synthase [Alphaproteobacteria bacterium]USO04617.1 MAG: NAD+ synthase [Rhodospirillales bacterium]
MANSLTLTLAQLNPIVGALSYNLEKIRKIRDTVPEETDLILYPEMILTGYPPEDLVLKPFFMEKVEEAVETLVKESAAQKPWLIVPTPWRQKGNLYNAALVIGEGKIQAARFKHRLPNYGVFDEQRRFTHGPLPEPVDFKGTKIGLMICEDMWYPESAAHLKKQGAEILLVPNASPFEAGKKTVRMDLARQRVSETGLPLIYLNQVGGQDELVFDGGSFALNEAGNVVLQAEAFAEDIHHTLWEKSDDSAQGRWLCLTDTVHPPYEGPEELYRAVTLGLRDYVQKNGFPGVLIGMSGGIDSALSAAIAADALGPEHVTCVMMPSPFTSKESLEDAAACAEALGTHYEIRPIEPAMKAFEETLHITSGIAHENMQSRCRGLILMALSNDGGKMVLSTGNKSEMAVGYATLYGDMCGGFNALKDLYKTQVYELARWRNTQSQVIPENIITKAPTAELKANQRDQDTLPPYEELDDILACLIEKDMGLPDIAGHGHSPETVRRVWQMLDRAEYKRRQAPPGVKITSRAFGRDRRYPITNRFLLDIGKQ